MEAYIVPGWVTIVAGLVIYRRKPEPQVLLGLHSVRFEAGKWCLPTGLGVIRRDISSALAFGSPATLRDPVNAIQGMSESHKQALLTPAGFALAEAKWYIELPPNIGVEQLVPLKPICQLGGKSLLVKVYFGLEWEVDDLPKPVTEFAEVKFFTREELKSIPIAFEVKDLNVCFWPRHGKEAK
ncbi:MAG: hypothetical protein HYT20_00990 [Candidatus Nealsonbacteria bacterium]|nr:hypothetical protein [Candidatus Nealsonbacteria bacterium]